MPIEELFKLFSSILVIVIAVYQFNIEDDGRANQAIGQLTVFCFFACSALLDIFTHCSRCLAFPGHDYLVLIICFNLQSIMFAYHTDVSYSWFSVADTCAMYAATLVAVGLLLEYKYTHNLWFALMRAFMAMVLGTWCFHIFIVQLNSDTSVTHTIDSSDLNLNNKTMEMVKIESQETGRDPAYLENLAIVPMYFSWHILFNVNAMTVLWVVVNKLANKNCGMCLPDEEGEVTHFENRVHFDYHMITRMTDSDYEQD